MDTIFMCGLSSFFRSQLVSMFVPSFSVYSTKVTSNFFQMAQLTCFPPEYFGICQVQKPEEEHYQFSIVQLMFLNFLGLSLSLSLSIQVALCLETWSQMRSCSSVGWRSQPFSLLSASTRHPGSAERTRYTTRIWFKIHITNQPEHLM